MRKILIETFVITLCFFGFANAQKANIYGLNIISDPRVLKETIHKDPNKALVRIKDYVTNIALDIKYATTQNYSTHNCIKSLWLW